MRGAWLRTWRVFFLSEHPCEEMLQLFPAGISCWGQPGWEQPNPGHLPSADLLTHPPQSWESSHGIQSWEALDKQPKQEQQKGPCFRNRKKNQNTNIQSSPNELHDIIFYFLTHLLALEKPFGGGCGTGRALVMPQRHGASLSLAHC